MMICGPWKMVALLVILTGFANTSDSLPAPATVSVPAQEAEVSSRTIVGFWLGTLHVGALEFRVALALQSGSGGAWQGTLRSLDQASTDRSFDVLTWEGHTVAFELSRNRIAFSGTLDDRGQRIDGQWKQGGRAYPITFERVAAFPERRRPQEPKPPLSYDVELVTFENHAGKVRRSGTLTLTRSRASASAVLLISGSGAQDRDESAFGHRPFLVLADNLTRRGIVVLRVDDRGVGGSTGDLSLATLDDSAGDVLSAVQFLKGRKEVDSRRIGLIGHSEGGVVAALAAARSREIAFVVMLGAPGVPFEDVRHAQTARIGKSLGASDAAIESMRGMNRRLFALIRSAPDRATIDGSARFEVEQFLAGLAPAERAEFRELTEMLVEGYHEMNSPWFRSLLAYDPQATLTMVQCPVLALFGGKDIQVAAAENLEAIRSALRERKNADFTAEELADLNHLFQSCETGALSEYGRIEETFAPVALSRIGGWIEERFGTSQPAELR